MFVLRVACGLFVVAFASVAYAQDSPEREPELQVGGALGGAYTAFTAENERGGSFDGRVELRLLSPDGFGVTVRGLLALGSPNLGGGEVGPAFQTRLALLPRGLSLWAGAALGLSFAARFYLAWPISFGPMASGGGGAPADTSHLVGGYFAELSLDMRTSGGFFFGIAAVHRGYILDTHPEERTPIFSIAPSIRLGRAFDL